MTDVAARLTMLTRIGFAARGLLYLVIAMLVLTAGRAEDPAGALEYLGERGGQLFLLLIILGFLAYGLWRLADAAFDIERHGNDGSGLRERVGAGVSGVAHLLLAWQAIRLSRGANGSGASDHQASAETALQLPAGGMLLTGIGVLVVALGLVQLMKAGRAKFLKDLEPQIARQPWALWIGRAGYAARGLVFLITGYFLLQAGLNEQASRAGGMAEALGWLNNPWDIIVALGLFAFGMFSLIEARFRVLHDVPVGIIGQRLSSHLR